MSWFICSVVISAVLLSAEMGLNPTACCIADQWRKQRETLLLACIGWVRSVQNKSISGAFMLWIMLFKIDVR